MVPSSSHFELLPETYLAQATTSTETPSGYFHGDLVPPLAPSLAATCCDDVAQRGLFKVPTRKRSDVGRSKQLERWRRRFAAHMQKQQEPNDTGPRPGPGAGPGPGPVPEPRCVKDAAAGLREANQDVQGVKVSRPKHSGGHAIDAGRRPTYRVVLCGASPG